MLADAAVENVNAQVDALIETGVPRSTARGWLGAPPTAVVGLDVADLTDPDLRHEVVKLRRRVRKLTVLLRLALALLRTSGFRLAKARLPDGRAKMRILRAVERAREYLPLRAILRFLRVSPRRFHAWRRRQRAVAVGTALSGRPPHRSQRAALLHWALTSGSSIKPLLRPRM